MNLNDHHIVLVNTSAGKDSQTALDVVCRQAEAEGFDRTNLHVFADRDALLLAGEHNPELLREYVAVEQRIRHTFKPKLALVSIQTALANGERGNASQISWAQCA